MSATLASLSLAAPQPGVWVNAVVVVGLCAFIGGLAVLAVVGLVALRRRK